MLLRITLALALLETLLLAGLLRAWADRVAGGRQLATFLLGIAVWITGNELPNWFGLEVERLAFSLLATAPLTSSFFFHFCVHFCRVDLPRWGVPAAYALGGVSTTVAMLLTPAVMLRNEHVGWFAIATPVGWLASLAWVVLGIAGVSVLLRGWLQATGPRRAQIAAVTLSCLWGLLCLSGYAVVVLEWPVYPWPLLALPLYPAILVYGILRYGVFVSNDWAGRALVWTLLLGLGAATVAVLPLLVPTESRWVTGLSVAVACLALNGPVRRFVHRLIYPGGEVSAADLVAWRQRLGRADTLDGLAHAATGLLSQRLGSSVEVVLAESAPATQPNQTPRLVGERGPEGWQCRLQGWEAAPPGQRHVAELFGTAVSEAAGQVEQALALAARERERQLQARLAELGALAATVAHDIRNPLNIIGMAVATAPADTRRDVAEQVARIAHLTRDLLDFAKPWQLRPIDCDLAALARVWVKRVPGARLGLGWPASLPFHADPARLEQAVVNLLENARAGAAKHEAPPPIELDIDQDDNAIRLHVCDDGPGVPLDLRDRLFQPFASRSPGGTGLGLAIVARVAQAHGGDAALTERPPWRTCFTLELPRRPTP